MIQIESALGWPQGQKKKFYYIFFRALPGSANRVKAIGSWKVKVALARARRATFELSGLNQRFLLAHQARQFGVFGAG